VATHGVFFECFQIVSEPRMTLPEVNVLLFDHQLDRRAKSLDSVKAVDWNFLE
jgi:hypothetical protein